MIRNVEIIHFISNASNVRNFILPLMLAANDKGYNSMAVVNSEDFPIDRLPVKTLLMDFRIKLNPITFIQNIFAIKSLLKDLNPDVVHAHMSLTALIPLLVAYFLKIENRIYHNHGTGLFERRNILFPMWWLIERMNCAIATDVIFVNSAIKDEFIRLKMIRKGVILASGSICGIDKDVYASKPVVNQEDMGKPFQYLFVGRPHHRKGFHFLIQIWCDFFAKNKATQLVLAGCSEDELKKIVPEPPENIKALGFVDDMVPVYRESDALVHPSFHEGFPYCILESLAAGVPCIVSDILAHHWAINSDAAIGVPIKDEQGFVKAMLDIYQNSDLRQSYIQKGHVLADKYDRKRVVMAYLDYMEKYKTIV